MANLSAHGRRHDGPDLITIHNDAFVPILGDKASAIGRSFRDVWAEAWSQIGPIAERAYAGESTFIENYPLLIDRHGYGEQTYFTFCYSPLKGDDGKIVGMIDMVVETTERSSASSDCVKASSDFGLSLPPPTT